MLKNLAKKAIEAKLKTRFPFKTVYIFTEDLTLSQTVYKWGVRLTSASKVVSVSRSEHEVQVTITHDMLQATVKITDRNSISEALLEESTKVIVDKDYSWYDKEKHKGVTEI